ncbi:MAG: TIGR03862 family flavoprotein [Bacteroidia bacterium]|nr:TIGR03862 family flavoprotein [Bacteroidia bacterium]
MKKTVNIIGGGPSAMMLASELNVRKFEVNVYEKNSTLGRKFLVAGQGGFNLTHSEPPEKFIKRYHPSSFLESAFLSFSNQHFIKWLSTFGIETFVGSSGRIFPTKGIKPIQVLNALLKHLVERGVKIYTDYEWEGFTVNNDLIFKSREGKKTISADITVFGLGGASWPITGSKGDWLHHFSAKGVLVNPFEASNCALKIAWPKDLLAKLEGKAIKNCVFSCGNHSHAGEAVLTGFGIEGSGVYPLSVPLRAALKTEKETTLCVDFKPNLSEEKLLEKLLSHKNTISYSKRLQVNLNLSDVQRVLIKHYLKKEDFLNPERLVYFIKHFPLRILGLGPIDDAISAVGGISIDALTEHFELKKIKNTYAIGEMLDYDAPTGGYLLQSCFSMGHYLAQHLNSTK